MGVPKYVNMIRDDPEQNAALTISRNMWVSNPGYIVRDAFKLSSTMKQDYVWDEEEVTSRACSLRPGTCLLSLTCPRLLTQPDLPWHLLTQPDLPWYRLLPPDQLAQRPALALLAGLCPHL